MRQAVRQFFAPPAFREDEDKTRSAGFINVIGWSSLIIVIALLVLRVIQGQDANLIEVNLVLIAIVMAITLVLYLSSKRVVKLAGILLVMIAWLGLSYVMWIADGIRDVAYLAYSIPILMAGLLLGWQSASVFALLSILSGWILAYAETMGKITPTLDTPLHFARDTTGIFLLETVLIYLMIASLRSALNNSRSITRELSDANQELNKLRVELEQRVIDRTSELEKRASQLETVSEVARTIASMQDLDRLLPAITKLISQQFGYYHVGIFLLDERNGRAVLRASNSAGGLHLIRQHHSLPLEENSSVGYTISHGEPRIVKDLSLSHIPLDQSILPETRSESAIPLRLAGKVIGSIDIQSSQIDAFTQEDIDVLTTLADQAAIAIENARLFSETKNALAESQALFEKYTQQEWRSFSQQTKHTGFVFDGKQVIPLENKVNRGPVQAVFQTGGLSLEKASATIAVPIKLRGQTIGVLDVRSKSGNRDWNQDEITLLEAAAERAGLALENARLIENAQRRAARERAIGDIATKIGAVSNLESILQTAVEELGRKIGGATEVTLEFSSNDERNQG